MFDEHEQVVTVIASRDEKSPIQVGGFVGARPGQLEKGLLACIVVRESGLPSSARTTEVKVYKSTVLARLIHRPIHKMKNDEQGEDMSRRHNQKCNVRTIRGKLPVSFQHFPQRRITSSVFSTLTSGG